MSDQRALSRLLSPASLAVVGANEALGMSNNAVLPMLEAGRTVHLVNPTRQELYGLPALPSLTALGAPVDAVLSLVNAERSVAVVEEAAALGCGGVVVAAAGFSEMGDAGSSLQHRISEVARETGLAVIGPNCSGFKNVPLGVNLFTGGRIDPPPGGVSIVSQSGFLMRSAMAAADQRRLGVAISVSSGNEAVCDLADYVEAFIDDPSTSVICLVIETIRRPAAFFSAVARARRAGMSVLALKLGRSDRARQIMQSHTGSIAGDSWVYELAFAEHGIVSARDVDDLFDRAQLLAQLPADRHSAIGRIGIITTSGGVAALATDLADSEGLELPTLEELAPWVRERVPGDTVNPLDLTGFVMSQPDVMRELFDRYADAVDALVLAWWLGEGDEAWSTMLLGPFAAAASGTLDTFRGEPGGGDVARPLGRRLERARPCLHPGPALALPSNGSDGDRHVVPIGRHRARRHPGGKPATADQHAGWADRPLRRRHATAVGGRTPGCAVLRSRRARRPIARRPSRPTPRGEAGRRATSHRERRRHGGRSCVGPSRGSRSAAPARTGTGSAGRGGDPGDDSRVRRGVRRRAGQE